MMRRAALVSLLAAAISASCAGPRRAAGVGVDLATYRAACPADQFWSRDGCRPRGDGAREIEAGARELAAFEVDAAQTALARARSRGPYRHADHVRLYEQLGIAYAYLGQEAQALEAFGILLDLDPAHLLSYTLSPKATFLFEKARRASQAAAPPSIALSWPRDLQVVHPVPIDIEVVADPRHFLRRAALHVRARGERDFRLVDIDLAAPGSYRRVLLPPPGGDHPRVLELYVTAFDRDDNEVLLWAAPEHPRELPLRYQAPVPWYRKWWVWAIAGSAVAAGTGVAVFALTRDPPATIDGDFSIAH